MRATVVFVTALLVVGTGAPFAAAAPSTADAPASSGAVDVQDDATNESENETAPGAQLAGVADVQGAEVEGEVEKRSFGLQVAAANSNASRASVVAEQAEALGAQLAALQQRKAELEAARENGTISTSRYRAEIAGLAARISTLRELTNATTETARGLPASVLAERGVNVSAIDRLGASAANLSGPEVAAIARGIAGPPNGTVGPPSDGNGPPFGPSDNENRTTGPPDDAAGNSDKTTGTPDDRPGSGQGTGAGENATDTPGANNSAGDDASAAENSSSGPGTGTTPGNSANEQVSNDDTATGEAVRAPTVAPDWGVEHATI